MRTILLIALVLQTSRVDRIYEKVIDETHMLSVVRTVTGSDFGPARVLLIDKANRDRFWEIETLSSPYDTYYRALRADGTSAVFMQTDDYGILVGFTKLFFDVEARRLVKRIDYATAGTLAMISNYEARRSLNVPLDFITQLKALSPSGEAQRPVSELQGVPLPQSKYSDFARLRPGRVKNGYDASSTITEEIGPQQRIEARIWFGKSTTMVRVSPGLATSVTSTPPTSNTRFFRFRNSSTGPSLRYLSRTPRYGPD